MPTRYTKTCIPQYCRYHTEWPKEAFLPAQFQGVQKGHVDASQDTVGVRHARDVAQDRQYLAGDGQRPIDGQQKRFCCCTSMSGKLIHEHLWDRRTESLSVRRGAEIARRADRGEAHEQFTQLRSSPER